MGGYLDTSHDDRINGSDGSDTFYMYNGGDDRVFGMGGDDQFYFMDNLFDANDTINGGTGYDLIKIHGDYSAGLVFSETTLTNVEEVELDANPTGHDDRIVLNDATIASGRELLLATSAVGLIDDSAETDGSLTVLQYSGPCTIDCGGADDKIIVLSSWSAKDSYDGAGGADRLILSQMDGAIRFSATNFLNFETLQLNNEDNAHVIMNDANVAAGGVLTVTASWSLVFEGGAERDGAFDIISGDQRDIIEGGRGADTVEAAGGNDALTGGSGDDQLSGSSGRDLLSGGVGSDQLVGGFDADTLIGGAGADQLTGGDGADTFAFTSVRDSTHPAMDHILDLEGGDSIDLSAIDADTTTDGDQAFVLVDRFSHHAGEARLSFRNGVTTLSLDVNGDGRADSMIAIDGDHHLFKDFVF